MTSKLKLETSDQLVDMFTQIALGQYDAIEGGEIPKFNRLFARMEDVSGELKLRSGDQRRLLIALYAHSNSQVRLKAAVHTLAVAPIEARGQLEEIRQLKWEYQAGDAGMILRGLDDGTFKPS